MQRIISGAMLLCWLLAHGEAVAAQAPASGESWRQQLGRYRVQLDPPHAVLTIGGQQVVPDAAGYVWLRPGRYYVSVWASGYDPLEGELVVAAGDDGLLSYALPALAPEAPRGTGSGGEADRAFPVVPVVVASIGGAMLIGSIVTGVLALGEKDTLDEGCAHGPGHSVCPVALRDTRDAAETLAVVTDVLWIGGTLAVGTGLLLYLLQDGDSEQPPLRAGAAVSRSGAALTLSGRF